MVQEQKIGDLLSILVTHRLPARRADPPEPNPA
jgi:hypothetical protein